MSYEQTVLSTKVKIEKQILKSKWGKQLSDTERSRTASQMQNQHFRSIELIRNSDIPLYFLANPKFESNGVFKQDKVSILTEFFSKLIDKGEISRAKEILKEYIQLNLRVWEYGIYERSFNFTLNNGIDGKGNVVFVDLGEFSDDFQALTKCLREKNWMECWTVEYDLAKALKHYYLNEAKDEFTLENLVLHWNHSGSLPECRS